MGTRTCTTLRRYYRNWTRPYVFTRRRIHTHTYTHTALAPGDSYSERGLSRRDARGPDVPPVHGAYDNGYGRTTAVHGVRRA